MNLLNPTSGGQCSPMTPYGEDFQRKLEQSQKLFELDQRANGMKNKLSKIAELFELDVLSEEDALKACKIVIQQHSKVQGKTGRSE